MFLQRFEALFSKNKASDGKYKRSRSRDELAKRRGEASFSAIEPSTRRTQGSKHRNQASLSADFFLLPSTFDPRSPRYGIISAFSFESPASAAPALRPLSALSFPLLKSRPRLRLRYGRFQLVRF
jgi:hypothetical protein